jgi:uncharacterized protein YndB with AHSA1/START domain
MQTVERVIINATPADIWQVLADVERRPTWTPTVLDVRPIATNGHKSELKVGSRYRVTRPKLRPAVYEVTECAPHRAFTWIRRAPGATMIADHRLSPFSSGTEVELSFSTEGLIGAILGGMYSKRIASYVRTEALNLKQHCESRQPATAKAG